MLNEFRIIYIRRVNGSYNHNYSGECITCDTTKLSNIRVAKPCLKK
jgi:hypothetical protein